MPDAQTLFAVRSTTLQEHTTLYARTVDILAFQDAHRSCRSLWAEIGGPPKHRHIRNVRELVREAYFVPEAMAIDDLLAELRRGAMHFALVVDEYGTVSGFVTLEDVIEVIVGRLDFKKGEPLAGEHALSWVDLTEGYAYGHFMSVGGAALTWLKNRFDLGGLDSEDPYRSMEAEAASRPPGAGGVIFLPHMMGERAPYVSASARGVLYGLSLGHSRGHVFRAVMEGVAMNLRWIRDSLAFGGQIDELVASGGGARSALFRGILANVLDLPLYRPSHLETTSSGVAF